MSEQTKSKDDFPNGKHTPGPWNVYKNEYVSAPRVKHVSPTIADCTSRLIPILERLANARLIAAAPELLAACNQLVDTFFGWVAGRCPYCDAGTPNDHDRACPIGMAIAAIAKAKGE